MWLHFLSAIGLVFIIEGILPFLTPKGWRRAMLQAIQSTDTALRVLGLVSMVVGLIILYSFHNG